MSILLYGSTTRMLTTHMRKKLDGNCTRMLRAIWNKSWWQDPTKQQLYGHLPPILKTIQVRWTRYVGYCWRSKDKSISDDLLSSPSHWRAHGWLARTYQQQLCTDTGCNMEDLPKVMDDSQKGSGKSMLAARHHDDDICRDRLLRHCNRCASRRYFSPISVYYLPRLRA